MTERRETDQSFADGERIAKYLASAGVASRRGAEKLIAAAILSPIYESALLVGIGNEKRSPAVDALQDEEDRPQTVADERPLFGRLVSTRAGELTKGKVHVGIFAKAVRDLTDPPVSEVSVELLRGKYVIEEDNGTELAAQVAHYLP